MVRTAGRPTASVLGDSLRTQLWPLPTISVALAVAGGIALPRIDRRFEQRLPVSVTEYLFGGSASAARTVLDAIASSLITVTSLTFSLTVVTLQLASSQFSPRLLRTFTRDRFVHLTLGLFLATFTFAITVLRSVRDASATQAEFVPRISVTAAFLLVLASVVTLVLFLAHLTREIRVEAMLRTVHDEAVAAARDALVPISDGPSDSEPIDHRVRLTPPAGVATATLLAASTGFLVRIDESALLAAAVDTDAVVVVDRAPGSFLVAGTRVGAAWPRSGGRFASDAERQLRDRASGAIAYGFERTAVQDVGFGLRQIADVAGKALSPGINDPTTAVYAVGYACALLCELAHFELGPRHLRDEEGQLRVALARPDLSDLLELAVAQPRRYGAADPVVMSQLLELLRDVAWSAQTAPQRQAVAEQLARLHAVINRQEFDAEDRRGIALLADQVRNALHGAHEQTNPAP